EGGSALLSHDQVRVSAVLETVGSNATGSPSCIARHSISQSTGAVTVKRVNAVGSRAPKTWRKRNGLRSTTRCTLSHSSVAPVGIGGSGNFSWRVSLYRLSPEQTGTAHVLPSPGSSTFPS